MTKVPNTWREKEMRCARFQACQLITLPRCSEHNFYAGLNRHRFSGSRLAVLLLAVSLTLTAVPSGAHATETTNASPVSVDFAVRELRLYPEQPEVGSSVRITTLVLNHYEIDAPMVMVFAIDEGVIKMENRTIRALGFQQLEANWRALKGNHSVRVEVLAVTPGYEDVLPENNVLRANLNVAVLSYTFTIAMSGNLLGQTRLFVDNVFWGSYTGGQSIALNFEKSPLFHNVTVDREVRPTFGVILSVESPTMLFNETGKHTFNYEARYQLQYSVIPPDVELPVSSSWYPGGSYVSLPTLPAIVEKPGTGRRLVFRGWTVDGRPYEKPQLFMDGPHFAQASYDTYYQLTVLWQNNDNRCASVPAEEWQYAGSTVSVVPFPSGCPWIDGLGQWLGLQSTASASKSSVTMEGPATVTLRWTDPTGPEVLAAFGTSFGGWIAFILQVFGVFGKVAERLGLSLKRKGSKMNRSHRQEGASADTSQSR